LNNDPVKLLTNENEPIDSPVKKKRGRPRGSGKFAHSNNPTMDICVKQEESAKTISNDDDNNNNDDDDHDDDNEDVSSKSGARASLKSIDTIKVQTSHVKIKEEHERVNNDDESQKRKRGRPRGSSKATDRSARVSIKPSDQNGTSTDKLDVKQERIPSPVYDDSTSTNTRSGRTRRTRKSSTTPVTMVNMEVINDDVKLLTRRGRKRKNAVNDTQSDVHSAIDDKDTINDESLIEERQCFVRRSSRPRKIPAMQLTSSISTKATSQVSNRLVSSKSKHS
jgi:hypothetical protein